jgi:cysteinyl-tRNA synthetase
MSTKYLGENFEIHGGGRDLIFPHHENEIAQSESFTGKPFAKIWLHVGMVTINGEKMSKSLGNIKSVKYMLEHWSPNVIRLFCMGGHYSKPIDYSEDLLKEHETNWNKARLVYHKLVQTEKEGVVDDDVSKQIVQFQNEFNNAMADDLNTHLALSVFHRLVTFTLGLEDTLTNSISKIILSTLENMMNILGLKIDKASEEEMQLIKSLIKQRNEFREKKMYEEADQIREKLSSKGIELKDEIHQTVWMKKE